MTFSYGAIWDDVLALLRANAGLIASIAGAFVFLPLLLLYVLAPPPPPPPAPADALNALMAYWRSAWHWYLLAAIFGMIGSLAILRLVLARGGTTVGEAIQRAFLLLPAYLAASILVSFAILAGFLLLIVPGLYVAARMAPLPAVIAGDRLGNPLEAIRRTILLTHGHGWAILGLALLIAIPAWMVAILLHTLFGLLFLLLAGQQIGTVLGFVVAAAANAAASVLLVLLYGALYRRLTSGT